MAIYGNLSSLSLQDVAIVIRPRTGVLTLLCGTTSYRLNCHQDQLCHLFVEEVALHESDTAIRALSAVVHQPEGSFRFEECAHTPDWLQQGLGLPFCETLAFIRNTTPHQTSLLPPTCLLGTEMPHPDTRYILLLRSRKPPMSPRLAQFLEQLKPWLEKTFSARELAEKHAMKLEHVCYYLGELRKINRIMPVRAYWQPEDEHRNTESHTAAASPWFGGNPVVKRLLSLLRGSAE